MPCFINNLVIINFCVYVYIQYECYRVKFCVCWSELRLGLRLRLGYVINICMSKKAAILLIIYLYAVHDTLRTQRKLI